MVMVVILAFLLIFFCFMPYIKELTRRAQYWEDPANDPRWNKDHFQFSPKLERAAGEGYERLSVGSSVGSRCGYWAVIGHMLPQYRAVIG